MHNFKDILFIGLLILQTTYAVEYNIALNKAVTTSNNVSGHLAAMAIDQDLHTYVQVNPESYIGTWILFDLKGIYNITKIIIWPTNDYDFVLARVSVNIRSNNNTAYALNDLYCTYDRPEKGVAFYCSIPDKLGRFVVLNKMYLTESIKIAEVAILTSDTDLLVPITRQVEQSNVLYDSPIYNALKATDGDLKTCIHTAQDTLANRDIPGWWRTDLGDAYQVSAVNINDYYAQQDYRRDYAVYVDSGGFTKLQLCSFFNQSLKQFTSFFPLKCNSVLTGRYLTVEKISSADRPDTLTFCEIQVVAIHKDSAYTFPANYFGESTTSTTTTTTTTTTAKTTTTTTTTTTTSTTTSTTKTPVLSSPTSPLTTSSTTKTPSTSTTAILTSPAETCFNNCSSCKQREKLIEMEKFCQKKETEKIVIGVVVGLLTAIIFIILGFVCGYMYHKKKNVKPMEPIYEKTKEENTDQHVYSDLNNTPMKEINPYDNEN